MERGMNIFGVMHKTFMDDSKWIRDSCGHLLVLLKDVQEWGGGQEGADKQKWTSTFDSKFKNLISRSR